MLVVFSPIFVADTKVVYRYDFVAPLNGFWDYEAHFLKKILIKKMCNVNEFMQKKYANAKPLFSNSKVL